MKPQTLLHLFSVITLSACESHEQFFSVFSYLRTNEQLILGRCDEDVILPCLFNIGSQIVIHWKNQENIVHSYYKGMDHLEEQDLRYVNRTTLFHSEIHNGNASLSVRRLSLQDEGIYFCYVGTTSEYITKKVVLKVGAFHKPIMKYEKRNAESFLECSIRSVYPRPHITWKMDNAVIFDSSSEVTGALDPFYNQSTLNITGSNSSFECAIENSLLNQTWRGKWTFAGSHWMNQSDSISLLCPASSNFSLPNQDFSVTWSRVENGKYSELGQFVSSSQDTTTTVLRFSWNKEQRDHGDFSVTLRDLQASDSGEYLCDVSSTEYTLITVHRLHVAPSQERVSQTTLKVTIPVVLSLLLIVIVTAILCYYTWRRGSNDCNGIRRSKRPADEDQSTEFPLSQDEVDCGFEERIKHSSEMCPVTVDESVNNGDNSTSDQSLSADSDSK